MAITSHSASMFEISTFPLKSPELYKDFQRTQKAWLYFLASDRNKYLVYKAVLDSC